MTALEQMAVKSLPWWKPPNELLRRMRWGLVFFVPLALIPWGIGIARQGLNAWAVVGLVLLPVLIAVWVRAYQRDAMHWALELLHAPMLVALLLGVPSNGGPQPGQAGLFAMTMLLHLYAGPLWRFGVRVAMVVGGYLLVVGPSGASALIGLNSAALFSYLLGRALEGQRRSYSRALQLTGAASRLTQASSPADIAGIVAEAAATLAGAGARSTATLEATGLVPASSRHGAAAAPSSAGATSMDVAVQQGDVRGTLKVELDGSADDDLRPSLVTALTSGVQALGRFSLLRAQHEVEVASRIQSALLPRRFRVEGFDIAGAMLPASEVGGDYFDVLPVPGGCYVGIGDVSGHGLPAGLIMLMTQSVVSSLVRANPNVSPRQVVVLLNQVLHENVHQRLQTFEHVTFTLFRFGDDGTVVHAGAHEDVLIRRASGTIEHVTTKGTWVGAGPDISDATVDSVFTLKPGDAVLLHTDGIIENRNTTREAFGEERLEAAVAAAGAGDAQAVLNQLVAKVTGWNEQRSDDQSLLVVRYTGNPAVPLLAQEKVASKLS